MFTHGKVESTNGTDKKPNKHKVPTKNINTISNVKQHSTQFLLAALSGNINEQFPEQDCICLSYNSGGKASAAMLPILERLWRYKIVWISPNFTLRSFLQYIYVDKRSKKTATKKITKEGTKYNNKPIFI